MLLKKPHCVICEKKRLKIDFDVRYPIPPFYNVPIRILFLCQYVQSWRNVVPTFTNVLHSICQISVLIYLNNI